MKCRECAADGEYGCRAGFTSIIIDGELGCRDADRLLDAYHFNQVKGDSSTSTRTRTDRIRAMTDEELAKIFQKAGGCGPSFDEKYCNNFNGCPSGIDGWLDWPRQEAEE